MQTIAQMQKILYNANVDIMLYYGDTLSAVRTDDVEGFFYGRPGAQGFYPQQNLFINWRTAAPVGGGDASSGGTLWIVVAVVAAIVIAGAGLLIRHRATAGERE